MDTLTLFSVFNFDASPKIQPSPDVEDDAYTDMYMSYDNDVVYV